jgi:dihydroxyacid dehydratase/phosphogluconate dehydratase
MSTEKPPLPSTGMHGGRLRAPTRGFLRALGQDDEDIAAPHVAVIHTGGEMSPCNTTLQGQAQHAKAGIWAGGGTPHECPVVSVSDGLSVAHPGMRFSLVSRELIADSVEATVRGHRWDGIFAIGGCDKNMPGLLMGMVRCNVPSVFLYGGSALPGFHQGREVNMVDTYETIGRILAGEATDEELAALVSSCSLPHWGRAGVEARTALVQQRGSSRAGDAPIPTFPQRGKEKCTTADSMQKRQRSSRRRIFPVTVLGRSGSTCTMRGTL